MSSDTRDLWSGTPRFDEPQLGLVVDLGAERPFRECVLAVPPMNDPSSDEVADLATWEPARSGLLTSGEWLLAEFLSLADADIEEVRAFAGRFGPMRGLAVRQDGHPGVERTTESLRLWRGLARTLRALLDLVEKLRSGQRAEDKEWVAAIGALEAADGLRAGALESRALDYEVPWLFRWVLSGDSLPAPLPDSYDEQLRYLRWLGNRLLEAAGVRLEAGLGVGSRAVPYFELPARAVQDPGIPGRERIVVDGLLPLLTMQATFAARSSRTIRMIPCSGCGRPIYWPGNKRKPRLDQHFYGDHELCRQEARRSTKRESERQRYRRLKQLRAAP